MLSPGVIFYSGRVQASSGSFFAAGEGGKEQSDGKLEDVKENKEVDEVLPEPKTCLSDASRPEGRRSNCCQYA